MKMSDKVLAFSQSACGDGGENHSSSKPPSPSLSSPRDFVRVEYLQVKGGGGGGAVPKQLQLIGAGDGGGGAEGGISDNESLAR